MGRALHHAGESEGRRIGKATLNPGDVSKNDECRDMINAANAAVTNVAEKMASAFAVTFTPERLTSFVDRSLG
jgi:hypothetical protein